MRKIGILIGLAATVGGAIVGCSNGNASDSSTSSLSFTLVGDGAQLQLAGAPADPARAAAYPLSGLTKMNVRVSPTGDLTANCEDSGGATKCPEIPFFSKVEPQPSGVNRVQVYDIYGYKLVDHVCNDSDAGATPPTPPPVTGGGSCSTGSGGATHAGDGGTCHTGSGGGGKADAGGYTTGGGSGGGKGGGDNGGDNGGGYTTSGGGCGISVKADCEGCTLTVGSQSCDCSDAHCVKDAISQCGGGYTTSGGGSGGGGGKGGGDNGGGYSTSGNGGGDAGGGYTTTTTCDQATIDAAKQQFCADIDAWLKAHNITTPIDCTKVVDAKYDVKNPPAQHENYKCRDIISDGWVKVRATLAACDASQYINWESSSRWELLQQGDCRGSPLVLDLDGDGVNLSGLENGVSFDLLGTGEKVQTAWTRGGDALLAIDWNHNGTVDGASELFGNATFGSEHDDGFRALAELDANGDGRVDAKDPAFADLMVWRDADRNGVSRASELVPLRDAGVRAIDVQATRATGPSSWDSNGNDVSLVGRFVKDDGSAGVVVDAYLRFKPSR